MLIKAKSRILFKHRTGGTQEKPEYSAIKNKRISADCYIYHDSIVLIADQYYVVREINIEGETGKSTVILQESEVIEF